MTRKEWTAVGVVIAGGILLQIPGHDDALMDHAGMEHGEAPAEMAQAAQANARLQTVALDVTGMT